MKKTLIEIALIIGIAFQLALLIRLFVIPTAISGNSMEPGIHDKDYVLANRQVTGSEELQRGDIILFRSHLKDESQQEKVLIKRVIAVPGEQVQVTGGKVYINGEALEEDYIKDGTTDGEIPKVTVPEGAVFCLGDNRLQSRDSRDFAVWFVYDEEIIGKVFFRLYPFSGFGKLGD